MTSNQGISLDQLRQMLAESATFQDAVGGTEADVKTRVHFGRQVGSAPRPFAVIELESGDGDAISFGAGNRIIAAGGLVVRLERGACTQHPQPYLQAVDWFSRVVDDVNGLAGVDDPETIYARTHLPLLRVSLADVGENDRATWHSLGRFFAARTLWTWGDV